MDDRELVGREGLGRELEGRQPEGRQLVGRLSFRVPSSRDLGSRNPDGGWLGARDLAGRELDNMKLGTRVPGRSKEVNLLSGVNFKINV